MVEESIKMKEEVESTCNVGKLFSRTANMELPLEIPEFVILPVLNNCLGIQYISSQDHTYKCLSIWRHT